MVTDIYDLPEFCCPACGGRHFGRDTSRRPDGQVRIDRTVRCHDEHGTGCRWRGVWPEKAEARA